jgi:sugar lactone lactonase YvrE
LESRWFKPSGIVVDRHGDIICCDYQNHCIRKINTRTEMVETIAGVGTVEGFRDGPAKQALFSHPNAVCLTLDDNILVADTDNQRIRQISPDGWVTTLAGGNGIGSADGKGPDASFNFPVNLCVDFRGDIFIADWKNDLIRKFTYDY